MKLSVHKTEGQIYSHKEEVITFVYKLSFEEEVVIGDDLRANKCFLSHKTEELIQVGGSACIFSVRRGEEKVGPKIPKYFLVNLLDDEEDIGELIPGGYMLHAGIIGSKETESGFKAFEVTTEIELTIE